MANSVDLYYSGNNALDNPTGYRVLDDKGTQLTTVGIGNKEHIDSAISRFGLTQDQFTNAQFGFRDNTAVAPTPKSSLADFGMLQGAPASTPAPTPIAAPAYTQQDQGVASRVTSLTGEDSPLMQQARAAGERSAAARGLQNSSIAGQASEQAAITAATPIASQEAAQASQANLSNQAFTQNRVIQGDAIQSQQFMQDKDIAAKNAQLAAQLGSQEKLTFATLAADKERLGMQLTSQEQLAANDLAAAKDRLGIQTTSNERISGSQTATQLAISSNQNTSQERIAQLNATTQTQLKNLDSASQERIASMNVSSHDKQYAASTAASLEAAYMQTFYGIANNNDIPATARNEYLQHILVQRDDSFHLIEQMYGITLTWSKAPTNTTVPPTAPAGGVQLTPDNPLPG